MKKFFNIGNIDKLAKLVKRSASTIRRWKREGIPKSAKQLVKKVVEKVSKKKTQVPTVKRKAKKEPTGVPLTAREKKQQKKQRELALQEQKRIRLTKVEERWEREYTLQPYTQNRIVALFQAIEANRSRIQQPIGPKAKRRIKLATKIALGLLNDYANGARFLNPEAIQPLIDEYNLDEEEAYHDIYGYVTA